MDGWQPIEDASDEWLTIAMGATIRLTEGGSIRVLEGNLGYRIIEGITETPWNKQAAPPAAWS